VSNYVSMSGRYLIHARIRFPQPFKALIRPRSETAAVLIRNSSLTD
jgi:hypothetical protein